MRKFKIGILIPYSGIFSNLREDFLNGLELGMGDQFHEAEWVQEFIHMGDVKKVKEVMQKLVQFDKVHAIAGIVNNNVIKANAAELDRHRIPVMICNLGACIPDYSLSHSYLFYNSLHLWKSQWVMGKWAQSRFGGQPSINLSVYEGGYGMHVSFKSGAAASGAENVTLNVLKLDLDETDTSPLLNSLREQLPGHAHILLSGKEGPQFLQRFRASGLHTQLPVSLNPYINIHDYQREALEGMYQAATWFPELPTAVNSAFAGAYAEQFDEMPAPFSVLGYEAGLAFRESVQQAGNIRSAGVLTENLTHVNIEGPRGDTRFSTQPLHTGHPVYVMRSGMELAAIDNGISWMDADLAAGAAQALSGWQNPYLCV